MKIFTKGETERADIARDNYEMECVISEEYQDKVLLRPTLLQGVGPKLGLTQPGD